MYVVGGIEFMEKFSICAHALFVQYSNVPALDEVFRVNKMIKLWAAHIMPKNNGVIV